MKVEILDKKYILALFENFFLALLDKEKIFCLKLPTRMSLSINRIHIATTIFAIAIPIVVIEEKSEILARCFSHLVSH